MADIVTLPGAAYAPLSFDQLAMQANTKATLVAHCMLAANVVSDSAKASVFANGGFEAFDDLAQIIAEMRRREKT